MSGRRSARRRARPEGGFGPRRADDTQTPSAEEVIAIARQLRSLEFRDAAPSQDFRVALRERLLTDPLLDTAPVRTPVATARPEIAAPRMKRPALAKGRLSLGVARAASRLRFPQLGARPLAAVATLSMLVALAGLLVIASQTALPGDSLYALKRASERTELALTVGGENRALTLLSFADNRLTEVDGLLTTPHALGVGPSAADGPTEQTAELIGTALGDMDADTVRGTKLLTTSAIESADPTMIDTMSAWTLIQRTELNGLIPRLPESASPRATQSLALLDQVDQRLAGLRPNVAEGCQAGLATADDLGPLPSVDCPVSTGEQSDQPPTVVLGPPTPTAETEATDPDDPSTDAESSAASSSAAASSADPNAPGTGDPLLPLPTGPGVLSSSGAPGSPAAAAPPAPTTSSPMCLLPGPLGQIINICFG